MAEEALGLLERELSEYEYQLKNNTVAAKRKLLHYKSFNPEQYLEASCSLKESHILLSKLLSRIKEVRYDFRRLPEAAISSAFACGTPLDSVIKTEIETEIVLSRLEAKLMLFNEAMKRSSWSLSSGLDLPKTGLEEQLAESQKSESSFNTFTSESNENGKKSSFTKRVFG